MPYVRAFAFVTLMLSLFAGIGSTSAAGIPKPDQVFQLRADRSENGGVKLTWHIAPSHYLYRDKISASVDGRPVKVKRSPARARTIRTLGLRRSTSCPLKRVFLDANGSEIRQARVVGDVGVAEFLSKVATALRS